MKSHGTALVEAASQGEERLRLLTERLLGDTTSAWPVSAVASAGRELLLHLLVSSSLLCFGGDTLGPMNDNEENGMAIDDVGG